MPLTIGIDARAATEVRAGRGRLVRELLRALQQRGDPHRFRLYARRRWEELPSDKRFSWQLIDSPDPLWHLRTARRATRQCDIFLSTNSYLTVLLTGIPDVVIVYDLVTFEPIMKPNRRSLIVERLTLGAAVRRAAGVICISRATEEALLARFPRAAAKSRVALLGVSPALTELAPPQAAQLPAPGFVLAVGTLEPRKNLPRLVQAYAKLPSPLQASHPLVVVGGGGWSTGSTLGAIRSLGDRCIALGHVSDSQLAELYRRCAVFCYPSLGEGFGLPVLEAMAAGAAVVTSAVSSLPEVGGDAVRYVDPSSVDSICQGIRDLLEQEGIRRELSAAARKRAQLFSWSRTASDVMRVLEEVLYSSSRSTVFRRTNVS